jgi:hypothetical protein
MQYKEIEETRQKIKAYKGLMSVITFITEETKKEIQEELLQEIYNKN